MSFKIHRRCIMKWSKMISVNKAFFILTSMEKAERYGGVVWQSKFDSVGTFEFAYSKVDVEQRKFYIEIPEDMNFSKDLPLKFRFFYRSIIFDVEPDQFTINATHLECSLPSEIQIASRLPREMFGFPINKQLLSNLHIHDSETIGKIVNTSNRSLKILIFGLGAGRFSVNDPIHIVPTDKKFNVEEIRGSVHSCSIESIKQSSIQLEIDLESSLDKEMIDYLNKKGNLILISGFK